MASIGPFSFASLTGRLQNAGPRGVVTYRGLKRTKPVARPSHHVSTEQVATLADAWTRARVYRSMVGSWHPVVDGGGLSCPGALICDVRCVISPGATASGAELETDWTMIPHGGYLATVAATLTADPTWRVITSLDPVPPAVASAPSAFGYLDIDAMYGDAQWPLQLGQLEAMQRAADDLGLDGIPQPSTAGGSVTMHRKEASELGCANTMREMRSYGGAIVGVKLAGVSFPCAVRDVDVTWAPTPGLPAGYTHTLTAVADMAIEDDSTSGDDPGVSVAVVQVSSRWGSAWQTIRGALCTEADVGLSGVSGVTSFTIDHGATVRGQQARESQFTDYTGKWIRIQVREMEDGTPSVRGTVLRPVWWGKCMSYQLTGGRGMSAASVFQCAGLDAALQEIAPTRWYAIGQALGIPAQGDVTTDPGTVLPLNLTDGGNAVDNPGDVLPLIASPQAAAKLPEIRPDRSTSIVTRGYGTWMAQLILAAINDQTDGPRWRLSDEDNALSFELDGDMDGPKFGDLLGQVINVRHGVAYALEVDTTDPSEPILVKVYTTVQSAVNLPNGDTIPANAAQIALDLAAVGAPALDNPAKPEKPRNALESWTVTRSRAGEVDAIYIEGGHPIVAVTVGYKDGDADATNRMIKGWSAADETAWDAANAEARDSGPLQHVWRKFKLGTKYGGGDYFDGDANHTMRAGRQTVPAPEPPPEGDPIPSPTPDEILHGIGGETGVPITLIAGGASVGPKPAQLKLARFLPWPENFNWAAAVQKFGVLRDDREQPARVRVYGKGLASNSYEDLSYTWQVSIDEEDGAVILGNDSRDAVAIKAYLASKALLFTVGIVSPIPWRVSWRRPDVDRPCDWRRTLVIRDPSLTYWVAAAGTITSVNDNFTGRLVEVDDGNYDIAGSIDGVHFGFGNVADGIPVPRLAEILAMVKTHYENQTPTIEWTRRGLDFSNALRPGAMVTTAALPLDDQKQISLTMNANITGRRWRFLSRELSTTYATDRLMMTGPGGIGRAAGFNHVGAMLARMGAPAGVY
jgi:hypothetical protein